MTKSISELAAAAAESEAALRDGLARMGRKVDGGPLGGNLGGVAMDQARAHPFATAIIGAGLAWLALAGRGTATPDPKPENLMNWEDEGGLPAEVGEIDDLTEDWVARAMRARETAQERLAALIDEGRATAEEKAEVAMEMATELSEAFRDNLADLSDEAAERVIEARERAWEALGKGRAAAEDGLAKGADAARQHPFAATAIGLALGAALAVAMPRTRPIVKRAAPLAATALLAQAAAVLSREKTIQTKASKVASRVSASASRAVDEMAEGLEAKAASAKATARRTAKAATKAAKDTRKRANGAVAT